MMSNLETTSLMPSDLSTSTSDLLLPVQSQIRSSLIVAATGLGKAQPYDENILTPKGWVKMWQVCRGMKVIGANGKPTKVTGVFPQVQKRILRICFRDGTSVRCCEDHLWAVHTKSMKCRGRGNKVVTAKSLIGDLMDGSGANKWFVPTVMPIQYAPISLPIDPYVIGAMLGDGGYNYGLKFSSADAFIINEVAKRLPDDYEMQQKSAYDWVIKVGRNVAFSEGSVLRQVLGRCLSFDKAIPDGYMLGSVSQRIALLQGLMDTDGYAAANGTCQFSSTSEQLTNDVADLVRSLGGVARVMCKAINRYTYKGEKKLGRPSYSVVVNVPFCPFLLPRKAERWRPFRQAKAIVDIRDEGVAECKCISVKAEDSLYVTSGYTLTHNTVIMGGLAKTWPKGRVMLISHRYEINQQAIDQLSNICGEEVDLEQAAFEADQRTVPHRVVVASVQTLNSFRRKRQQYRMEKFDPMDFGLLLIDEAHRAAAVTYRRVIKHFLQNPECCVVGVTATPDRLDGIGMGNVFQVASSDLNALWGVENGWLVGPRQLFAKVDGLDLREVRTIGGDLDTSQLQRILELEKNLHEMAKPIVDVAGQDKQAIVFTASVKQAHSICEKIRDYHYREFGTETQAVALDGTLSPQDPKRKQIVKEFKAGDIQFLCNCGVACLDEQTEILTATGWVGIDDMSLEHQVAAWCPETEIIQFNKPLAVEVRDRRGDEQMVTLNTNRRSVRVTGDHRMAYMTGDCKTYRVSTAKEIVGRHVRIPVSGLSQPFSVGVDLEQVTEKTIKARVRSAAYVYRQQGISASSARALAEEGCRRRVDMVRKHVAELSMSELHLIGMWVGDGTVTRLKSGGVEYSIAQSLSYPNACNWIRSVISRSSIDHVEHSSRPGMLAGVNGNRMLKFSMPRGTGFGNQKRNGIYHIEQYLSKTNFRWLMGLSQEQLVWFIEGLWMADGEHGQCADPQRRSGARAKSWRIASANAELNDWLQAACACRNMVLRIAGGVVREGATRPLWTLNVASRTQHIATRHRFEIEQGWKQERVWCVKSTSGFIVTRRNGSVTITGNTEGFDAPGVQLIAIGRPTKSRALYQQMLGRGLRPLPGVVDNAATREERLEAIKSSIKPNCTVLDFVGQSGKHKLLCATDFMTGTDEPPEVKERANRLSGSGDFTGDQLDALREAREQLAKEREAARHKVTVGVNYQLLDTNSLYDLSQLPRVPGYMQRYQMSDKQKTMMLKLGYTEAQINKVKSKRGASVAIEHAINNPRTSFGMWMQRKKWEEARKGR